MRSDLKFYFPKKFKGNNKDLHIWEITPIDLLSHETMINCLFSHPAGEPLNNLTTFFAVG